MPDWVIALMFAVGAGAWVYAYLMRHTMRAQSSLIGATVVGVISFIVLFTLTKFVLHF